MEFNSKPQWQSNIPTSIPILMELILFISAFILFCSIVNKIVNKSKPQNLPPGPRQLPIIGNIHQLYGPQTHHTLRDLAKKYGPLMHLKLGEVSAIVVSSPEIAKEVLNEHDLVFARRPHLLAPSILGYNCSDIAFAPYGEYWRQLRKICTIELLSVKRVQTFRSIREAEVLNMIRTISSCKGLVINLSQMVSSLTYDFTARAAFGKRSKHREEFIPIVEELVKRVAGFDIADLFPSGKILQIISARMNKLEAIHKQVDRILQNIINEHKEKLTNSETGSGEAKDLVDVLLNIQQSEEFGAPLTDDNIKAVIFDIFSAGGETTSTTVDWTMSEMIKNPKVMKRAQEEVRKVFDERITVDESNIHELKYLRAVIKETMRLHPPIPFLLPRESHEQCEVYGYQIPAKTRVIVNAWAIGRDPMHWTDPEKFNPERFLDSEIDFRGKDLSFIPFGSGRRICPGISFALPSVELQLAQLLYHFDWKLPGELKHEELDMSENFALAVKRKNDLLVIPIPYCRSSVN